MSDFSMETLKALRQQTGVGLTKCKEALEECKGDLEAAVVYLRKLGLASVGKKEHRETKEGVIAAKSDDRGTAIIEVNVETDFVANNAVFRTFVQGLLEDVLNSKATSVEELSRQPSSQDPSLTVDEMRAVTIQMVGENIRIQRVSFDPADAEQSIGIYSHGNGKTVSLVWISGCPNQEQLAKDLAMHVVAAQPQFINRDEVPQEILEKEKEVIASQCVGKPQMVIDKIMTGKLNTFFQESCLLEQAFVKNPDKTVLDLVESVQKDNGRTLQVTKFLVWKIGAE